MTSTPKVPKMTDKTHTPEPWEFVGTASAINVIGPKGESIIWHGDDVDEPNIRRMVVCVNVLAGIPTEAIEAGAVSHAIEALRAIEDARNGYTPDEVQNIARVALAKIWTDEPGRRS